MNKETIILVHGLWLNGMDMTLLRNRLSGAGYDTAQFAYNSVANSPRENAAGLNKFINAIDSSIIHFVCHSLGGIVIRHLFHAYPEQKPGRVVTLGTPHLASSVARTLASFNPGKMILGKSLENGLLGDIPPWSGTHELGSIAGDLSLGMGLLIPGLAEPNDGTVAVEETRLDGMKDHIVIKASHFGLLFSRKAANLSIRFLKTGFFSKPEQVRN